MAKKKADTIKYSGDFSTLSDGSIQYLEQRGIRAVVHKSDAPPLRTSPGPSSVFRVLLDQAKRLLISQDEGGASQILDKDGLHGLRGWLAGIELKFGELSKEATAAKFLWALENLRACIAARPLEVGLLGGAVGKEMMIMESAGQFADAWHWWHMEVYDEHDAAFRGQRAEESRTKAIQARTAGARTRDSVLLAILDMEWQNSPEKQGNVNL